MFCFASLMERASACAQGGHTCMGVYKTGVALEMNGRAGPFWLSTCKLLYESVVGRWQHREDMQTAIYSTGFDGCALKTSIIKGYVP